MKKLIISVSIVVVMALGLTLGIQLLPANDSDNIIARIMNPIIPCACITMAEELPWIINQEYMETYFVPNYGVNEVVQVLYDDEDRIFAVTMSLIDETGNKLFIVETENFNILNITEVPNVIAKPDIRVEVIQSSRVNGNLLQVHLDNERVKLVTFDSEPEIIGEFVIVRIRRNGELELREIL